MPVYRSSVYLLRPTPSAQRLLWHDATRGTVRPVRHSAFCGRQPTINSSDRVRADPEWSPSCTRALISNPATSAAAAT